MPTVAEVVAAFRRALEGPQEATDGLLGTLLGLHANNLDQWKLEDVARDPAATDAVIATAKRGIDRLNLKRHHFVEQVDSAIDASIAQTDSAPPATESPGMVFDRLSVLVIRLHHTEVASGPYGPRLPVLREQLASLETALERLLRDVREGERSFLPYRHLKLYGTVESHL
jgi:hypothetical protein